MARAFALSGLLRLRHLQQDEAAGELAAANARIAENAARRSQASAALLVLPSVVTSAASLAAVAAARTSAQSMLADLDALGREYGLAAADAHAAFAVTRTKSVGLEKLEGRHGVNLAAEDLRAEQTVLDEIASTGWHRRRNEGTR
jgi:flagellar protein FliJ